MTSRDEILADLRAVRTEPRALPTVAGEWIAYADPFAQFAAMVESVGGQCLRVASIDEARARLEARPELASAKRIVSCVDGVHGNVSLDDFADPHELESVDWAILPGQFGVAENGAIWVTDRDLKHRAIYFIVQHLAIVLPAAQIVHHMHAAYERIAIDTSSLGLFISGPSKTADIEQSLVIGAHGPRSLTVFAVD
jgi:L-lactate dehydrogenase complex protein LldG